MTRLTLPLILLVNAALLFPELRCRADLNDNVLHFTLIHGMSQASNPLDFWSPEIALGMPMARLYQPLSHLIVVGVWGLTFKQTDLFTVFVLLRFLALVLLPLSFYHFARMLGFERGVAICAALLAPLVSAGGTWGGIGYESYVFGGQGLFPQLVATHFLLLTLGTGWKAIRYGESSVLPGVLLAATGWSNLLYGYVAGMALVLMPWVGFDPLRFWRTSRRRLLPIAGIGLLAAAPRVWVYLSDSRYFVHSSPWDRGREYVADSFGAVEVLRKLATGQLFDAGRLPVLTLLIAAGLIALAVRTLQPAAVYCAWAFAVFIALYFGRPFWGHALHLFGILPGFQIHRFIGPVQIFGVMLAAIGLEWIWTLSKGHLTLLPFAFVLALPVQERISYLSRNAQWITESATVYDLERKDLGAALELAKSTGGRVYAGMPAKWGGSFKLGQVPVYSFLPVRQIPTVGFLYLSFFPANDSTYRFNEQDPGDYERYNVSAVVAPVNAPLPAFLRPIGLYGRFLVLSTPSKGYFGIEHGSILAQDDHVAYFHAVPDDAITFRSTFHPKWKALVDGKPVATTPDVAGFVHVRVPQGPHTLRMVY